MSSLDDDPGFGDLHEAIQHKERMKRKGTEQVRANLVDAIEKAMEVSDQLLPPHGEEVALINAKDTTGFHVDPDRLERFKTLLRFVSATTMGVDASDGKGQLNVEIRTTDRERYPSPGLEFPVPYVHKIQTNKEVLHAFRNASINLSKATRELDHIGRYVERALMEVQGDQ